MPKCCARCGRWGVRQFRETGKGDHTGQWECTNDKACKARKTTALRGQNTEGE